MKHRAPTPVRRPVRLLASALGWLALIGIALLCVPVQFGGRTGYTVVAGHSMNPGYRTGDLVLTRQHSNYRIGQIVVFQVPPGSPGAGAYVVHRLVGGSAPAGWVTKGDHNREPDIWTPHNLDIRGTAVLHIPWFGFLLQLLRNPLLYCALGAVVVGRMLWPQANRSGIRVAQEPALG